MRLITLKIALNILRFCGNGLLHNDAHERAWDAGCGNGQASVALAEVFGHVTATDISAEQIAAALLHPKVSYLAARTEDMRFHPESLDLTCVAQALHWFDLNKFWPQVQAALKPSGVFAAVAYGLFTVNAEIDAISKQHFIDVTEPYQAEGNRMIARGYGDIAFPFEMIQAPEIAIACEWTLDQLMSYAAMVGCRTNAQRGRQGSNTGLP